MQYIYILNIDIKELKAKELGVTYEFDPSLDSSSELDLSLCFAATSPRIRVTRFRVNLLPFNKNFRVVRALIIHFVCLEAILFLISESPTEYDSI